LLPGRVAALALSGNQSVSAGNDAYRRFVGSFCSRHLAKALADGHGYLAKDATDVWPDFAMSRGV